MKNCDEIQALAEDIGRLLLEHDADLKSSCVALLMVVSAVMFEDGRDEDLAHRMLSVTWKATETLGRLH